MSVSPPMLNATLTQHFAVSALGVEYAYYHVANHTAMFGYYPGSTWSPHFHAGTDFSREYGAPVLAPFRGLVIYAGWAAGFGNFGGGGIICTIQTPGGLKLTSCHLSALTVSKGQSVSQGQQIGREGTTGVATGPHVHQAAYTGEAPAIFRNFEEFMAGGINANSTLLAPSSPTGLHVVIRTAGVNIRDCAATTCAAYRQTGNPPGYLINLAMAFGGWVTGGSYTVNGVTGNVWARVMLNGLWKYVAKPFVVFV